MDDAADPAKLIDLPSQLLDKVVEVLAKVGIELPALVLQLFLLALVLIALFATLRPLLPDWRNAKPLPLLAAGAIFLVAVGILFGIVWQALLPDHLTGRVAGQELAQVRVDLLDFRGHAVSTGGSVDTDTGEFIAYYSPAWNGRARVLRISSPACKPRELAIERGRLAAETESVWDFRCEQP
jgi:hypothetical protein